MNVERFFGDTKIISLKFTNLGKELVDVDHIFLDTNKNFSKYLKDIGLAQSFDFSSRNNKKIYTHEFLHTFIEFIKKHDKNYVPYFYSNKLTKDNFRNSLVKKLRSHFGFLIWENVEELSEIYDKLVEGDCGTTTEIETFLSLERKHRRMKTIRKKLDGEGLKFMSETYFNDAINKMKAL